MKRQMTTDEYEAVLSFERCLKELDPVIIHTEHTVFSPDNRFAGTVDIECEIDGEYWIIDIKTGNGVYDSYRGQLNAYKFAIGKKDARMGILQIGYKLNKKKWKLTEVEDDMDSFNAAYTFWEKENGGSKPMQKDLPLEIKAKIRRKDESA